MKYLNKRLVIVIVYSLATIGLGYVLTPLLKKDISMWCLPLIGIGAEFFIAAGLWLIYGLFNMLSDVVEWVGKGSSSRIEN